MEGDEVVIAHLLANRGYIPVRSLDAPPEFTLPFLEYFFGSWLQLLSAPYFWFYKQESLSFWFTVRFQSTYRPGLAFVCLVLVIALSLAWGLNPTEGYLLLALHTYSSALVAIHYGFLSPKQRKRFLTFSSVKQLRARNSFAEDPMTTAEALAGQPLSGAFSILNGALLRLLAESHDGTAHTLGRTNAGARLRQTQPDKEGPGDSGKLVAGRVHMQPSSHYLEFGHLVASSSVTEPASSAKSPGATTPGSRASPLGLHNGWVAAGTPRTEPQLVKVRHDAALLLQSRAKLGHIDYSSKILAEYCDMVQLDEVEGQMEADKDDESDADLVGKPQGISVTAFAEMLTSNTDMLVDDSVAGARASVLSRTANSMPSRRAGGHAGGASDPLQLVQKSAGEIVHEHKAVAANAAEQRASAAAAASRVGLEQPPVLTASVTPVLAHDPFYPANPPRVMPNPEPPGLHIPGYVPDHLRRLSSGNHRVQAAWGTLSSFRPYKWRLPARLFAREIAARASTGASISTRDLRLAQLFAFLAITLSAIQFAFPFNCVYLVSTGYCDISELPEVTPDVAGRIVVFLLAAIGAYDRAFVILRLILRIKARSAKRLQMLRALTDSIDFSASLRARLPFIDLRLPENACHWSAAVETLVNYYEQRDNVNSYEILSTIMAWNAVVSFVSLLILLLLALSFVKVQVQSFLTFAYWGFILSGGLGLAFYKEASTNDLLEELSRRLQHTRTLLAEEISSLRQASLEARAVIAASTGGEGDGVEPLRAASSALALSGDRRDLRELRMASASESISLAAGARRVARQLGGSPRADEAVGDADPTLKRPASKLDMLERQAQTVQTMFESASSLSIAQRDRLAATLENAARVLDGKIGELSSGAARSRLFGVVISFTLLRGFVAAVLTTVLSLISVILGNSS